MDGHASLKECSNRSGDRKEALSAPPKEAKGEGTKPIHIEEKKNSGKTEEGKEEEGRRGESLRLLFVSLFSTIISEGWRSFVLSRADSRRLFRKYNSSRSWDSIINKYKMRYDMVDISLEIAKS